MMYVWLQEGCRCTVEDVGQVVGFKAKGRL